MPFLRNLLVLASCGVWATSASGQTPYDVVVYGGTSAGVTAAVQTARMGKTVVLIEPGRHVGGLTSGGLGMTDSGDTRVIGGLSREFYRRIRRHYDAPAAWTREQPEDFPGYRRGADAMWRFEPHVAEAVFRQMLDEAKVPVVLGERLDLRPGDGVRKAGRRIMAISWNRAARLPAACSSTPPTRAT